MRTQPTSVPSLVLFAPVYDLWFVFAVVLVVLEEQVEVVEARRIVSTGIVRCRLSGDRGWVSETTADGEIILEVLPTE